MAQISWTVTGPLKVVRCFLVVFFVVTRLADVNGPYHRTIRLSMLRRQRRLVCMKPRSRNSTFCSTQSFNSFVTFHFNEKLITMQQKDQSCERALGKERFNNILNYDMHLQNCDLPIGHNAKRNTYLPIILHNKSVVFNFIFVFIIVS